MFRPLVKSLLLVAAFFVASANVCQSGEPLVIETTIQPDPNEKKIRYIADMTILSDGRIATADSGLGVSGIIRNDTIETQSHAGSGKAFNSNRISGIAGWPDGQFVMSNMGDSKIAVFSRTGDPLYEIGSKGSADGSLKTPRGIAVGPSGRLYVADFGNKRISVFSKGGVYLFSIGNRVGSKHKLGSPIVVRVDNLERVYVLEESSWVSIYDHRGNTLKQWGPKEFKSIMRAKKVGLRSMAVDARGYLYMGDGGTGKIYILNWQKEKLLSVFGSNGAGPGRFKKMSSLLALPGNKLAVADSGNKKIEIYKIALHGKKLGSPPLLDSVTVASLETMGCDQAYRLDTVKTICLTEDRPPIVVQDGKRTTFTEAIDEPLAFAAAEDNYFVLDDDFTIKAYNHSGKHLYTIGRRGKREGEFRSPRDIAYSNGQIYVADTGNNRVQLFSKQGITLGSIYRTDSGIAIFDEPVAVAADSKGTIYVADEGTRSIKVFSAKKEPLFTIDSANGVEFQKFYDVAVDVDDKLYVLAKVKNNEASIYIFQEGKQFFRFGSAGDSEIEIKEPNALAVSLGAESWVSVYNPKRKRLNTYNFEQVPATVAGLSINGGVNSSEISWRAGKNKTIARYRLYSSLLKNNNYQLLKELKADKTSYINHHKDKIVPRYYKITAVTGFGIEGYRTDSVPDEFRQSINLFRRNKFDEAVKGFEQLSVHSPRNGEIKKYYGLSLSALGKYELAAEVFSSLAKVPGYEGEGTNLQISALADGGNSIDASALVFNAIAEGIATLDTLIICGRIGLEIDDAISTIDCLEQGLEISPNHLEMHVLLGRAYIGMNLHEQALAEFDTALGIAPDNALVWYETGLAYKQMGRQSEATIHFENTLKRDTGFNAARLELVETYFETGEINKVSNLAVKLAANAETKSYGQYLIGKVALHKGNDTRAILAFTRSARADKHNVDAWLALADLYQAQGNHKKTYSILRQADKFNPISGVIAERLGLYHFAKGEHEIAIPYLSRASQQIAENSVTQLVLAESFAATGNIESAIKHATISLRIDGEQNSVRVLLASLYSSQGKNSKAIELIRDAIERDPGNGEYYAILGETYTEFNFYDDAIVALDKAMVLAPKSTRAMLALGKLYSKRRMFDKAISAFQRVNNIEPNDFHQSLLDEAHASYTKARDFASNAPRVLLSDLRFEHIFSATYKQYADKSLGYVKIENLSGTDYGGLKLRMNIKGYMDFPWIQEVPLLKANSTQQITLHASFSNKILEIDEDTGVQVELSLDYIRDGQRDSIVVTQPMTIYGKNAILWDEPNMIGSFVTPKDSALHDFVRPAINASAIPNDLVNKKLLTAMTLFEILSSHGIRYIPDPTSPYSAVDFNRVDYVQFARDTLRLKSGDCDDLVVLFSAGLENLGIETAVLDIPGHLFFMLNTGLFPRERDKITSDDELLAVYKGTIWIPIDATMIATSFAEAWIEGARKYRTNFSNSSLNIVEMHGAWEEFRPVTLTPQKNNLALPDQKILAYSIAQENSFLLEKSIARLIKPYQAILANDPRNKRAKMQIAIYYAKYGMDEKARQSFDELLIMDPNYSAVYNNRGNVYFRNKNYDLALNSYFEAETMEPDDPEIRINQAMAHYRLGDLDMAKKKFDEAVALNGNIGEQYDDFSKLITK